MKSEKWYLLVSDGNGEICDTCKKMIPADALMLSNYHTRRRVFICYNAGCIIKHPRNDNQDCIKISDIKAEIVMRKFFIVKKWGIDYWLRNVRPYICIGYESFADSIVVE